ncbi:hypothetical protein RB653_005508 [Dictyostelium firmibasis]|uniref:Carboxypeptidase n=1 Tax=Dictyostelium firmibasis TaxID=79012 RepID=A0AAN7U1D0_9MYCE
MNFKIFILLIILIIQLLLNNNIVESKLNFSKRKQTDRKPNPSPKTYTNEYYDNKYLKSLENLKQTPNDFIVTDLPGLENGVLTSYAGLLTTNQTSNGNLFFWFFPSNETVINPMDAPLLVWLNGGPGCSSMDSVFIETGPLRFNGTSDNTDTFYINPWSWHNSANMLYIDQPFGTGLSYVEDNDGLITNDLEINQNFYQFIQEFFQIFSNYSTLPFFISGESYAGHYIPNMASYILNMNENLSKDSIKINLQGVAIGNGYTHPTTQINSYREFGYYATGIIGIEQYNNYATLNSLCQEQLSQGNYNSDECANVFNTLLDDSGSSNTTQVNMYDYRLNDPTAGNNWPLPGINQEYFYLNRKDVREAIHATSTPHQWNECNDTVNGLITNQDESSLYLFPELLSNIRVLIYNGQFDIICNHVGTSEYLNQIDWEYADDWLSAPRFTWTSVGTDGSLQSGGYGKTTANLTFVMALGGSHMYPMNMPSTSLDMVTRFLNDRSFNDLPQSIGIQAPSTPKPVPLTLGAWIGITVGGCALGFLLGALIIYVIMKKSSKNGYYKVIQ